MFVEKDSGELVSLDVTRRENITEIGIKGYTSANSVQSMSNSKGYKLHRRRHTGTSKFFLLSVHIFIMYGSEYRLTQ